MKSFIFLSVVFMFSAFTGAQSCREPDPYVIEIKEESMLWLNTYIITSDSIKISKTNRPENKTQHFAIKMSKEESTEIETLFKNINLKTLQDKYVDSQAPADLYSYNFTFMPDYNTSKKVYIYQYKQNEIFNLVQKINQIIARHGGVYQISYTDSYFMNKK